MDKKMSANSQTQKHQLENQQAAINHSMHLQTLHTLTELYKTLTTDSSALRGPLERALIALVEPFGPPPSPSNIIS